MEIVGAVYVSEASDGLAEEGGDEALSEGAAAPGLCELVEVALHGLEHKVELVRGRVQEGVIEGDKVWVLWYGEEGLREVRG